MSPVGDTITSMMPWGSEVEDFNVAYRHRLIDVSLVLIKDNPWFGSATFMSAPIMQQMVQGEGIIDLVNTYLAWALSSGLVGASLFTAMIIGPFLYGAPLYFKSLTNTRDSRDASKADPIFRSLLTLSVGTAITIGTVSSITIIPWTYWLLTGMTVGIIQMHLRTLQQTQRTATHGTH